MKMRQGFQQPSFYRQGLLIVLPALILAGIGLFSLRQDRQLAQLEAVEQAKKLSGALTGVILPEAFRVSTAGLDSWQAGDLNRYKPQDDPLLLLANGGITAFLVDRSGTLIHPPQWKELPEPHPLPVEDLTEAQQQAWESSQAAVHANQGPGQAILQLEQLADLPPAFLALARYQLGVLWEKSGNSSRAAECFEMILAQYPEARSDSGVLLRSMAALHLLQMPAIVAPNSRHARELIMRTASNAVFEPSLLSAPLLGVLPEDGGWMDVWRCHERSRNLHSYWEQEIQMPSAAATNSLWQWVNLDGQTECLLMSRAAGNRSVRFALPLNTVETLINQAIATAAAPPYLGVRVSVAGRSFPSNSDRRLGAENLASSSSGEEAERALSASVFLSRPDLLYARQRTRTLWFGGLIGLSLASVLAGLLAARRAFERQRELGEMKTNFVSSVSHELRAPIASVRLMAEELEDVENPQRNRDYKRFIVQECRRLSGLIENVLDFARHEQGRKEYEFESTDFQALLSQTVRLMQTYAADKRIAIEPILRGDPFPVEADGRAMQQVLVNLLDNAIKHSPPGSKIEAGLAYNRGSVVLWVRDWGEGIPWEDHQRIFERFYRRGSEMRRKTQGVGLGLAIVKYVTEAHGGKVAVESKEGQGSCFTVALPAQDAGACERTSPAGDECKEKNKP